MNEEGEKRTIYFLLRIKLLIKMIWEIMIVGSL